MPRILVVDDNRDFIDSISDILRHSIQNCDIIAANNGETGIVKASTENPDLILLDIYMPGMDGYEACARLKADSRIKHIPIVMLSAIKTEVASRVRGLDAGADGFMTKLSDAQDLIAQINVMLRIKKSEDELRRKIYEHEQIRDNLLESEEKIKASLKEKEVLLNEVHHRVKNNLQIISSLLNLQSQQLRDQHDIELFKDTRNRVFTMALIHEKLYKSKNLSQIDFGIYIRDLVSQLVYSYEVNRAKVKFTVKIDNIFLGVDMAIPCAQIVNELVSNSLKYAFPDNQKGELIIKFNKDKKGKYILIISDNGIGLPKDLDVRETESLGLKIVNSLTEQIKGKIQLNRVNGTAFTITFSYYFIAFYFHPHQYFFLDKFYHIKYFFSV